MKKQINPATIEKYVKHTTILYPDIINRAVKSGWKIVLDSTRIYAVNKMMIREVEIKNSYNDTFKTAYYLDHPSTALYSSFCFDKNKTYNN